MATATETDHHVTFVVSVWNCSECEKDTLSDFGAPEYCSQCGADFEHLEEVTEP